MRSTAARPRPKTKIVCTLGPASRSIEMIEKLLREGMNVTRFNFSHRSHEYHQETLDNLRAAMEKTGILCAVMLDTKFESPNTPKRGREAGNGGETLGSSDRRVAVSGEKNQRITQEKKEKSRCRMERKFAFRNIFISPCLSFSPYLYYFIF